MSNTIIDKEAEICVKCGATLCNHISNTGVVYPCWTPSGRFSPNKYTNEPASPPVSGGETEEVSVDFRALLDRYGESVVNAIHDPRHTAWQGNSYRSALTFVSRLESRVADLTREKDAWREFAEHQAWCRYCGEDGVDACFDGDSLRDEALAFSLTENQK